MSTVLVLIAVLVVVFAWRTGRLADAGGAMLGKFVLPGKAS